MSSEEYRFISEAKREIEDALKQRTMTQTVRWHLRRAQEKLTKAVNWGEDEIPSQGGE